MITLAFKQAVAVGLRINFGKCNPPFIFISMKNTLIAIIVIVATVFLQSCKKNESPTEQPIAPTCKILSFQSFDTGYTNGNISRYAIRNHQFEYNSAGLMIKRTYRTQAKNDVNSNYIQEYYSEVKWQYNDNRYLQQKIDSSVYTPSTGLAVTDVYKHDYSYSQNKLTGIQTVYLKNFGNSVNTSSTRVNYEYNSSSQIIKETESVLTSGNYQTISTKSFSYTNNTLSGLTETRSDGKSIIYKLNSSGSLLQTQSSDGSISDYEYNNKGELIRYTANNAGKLLYNVLYSYHDIKNFELLINPPIEGFPYPAIFPLSANTLKQVQSTSYDPNGNAFGLDESFTINSVNRKGYPESISGLLKNGAGEVLTKSNSSLIYRDCTE